ncbi:MAG: ubiquitin family-domain-containing protein, partial [Olpidium bornovanus]
MAPLKLNVKSSKADSKIEVTVEETDTVKVLKEKLAEKAETPADRQRLIYSGRVLKDDDTVGSYKIQDGHTVHLVRGAQPPGSASSTAPASTPASMTAASTSSRSVPAAGVPGAAPTPVFGAGNMFPSQAGMGGSEELGGMGGVGGMGGLGAM